MNSIKYLLIFSIILLSSCKKEKFEDGHEIDKLENGLLVLNEGLFHLNNSALSWIDLSTNEVTGDLFLSVNKRGLGDTANDMIVYGGKIYITVTTSSTVEVLDKKDLKSIKQLSFVYQNKAQEPRNLIAHDGKVFISSYDGYISVLDTTSLNITKRIKVGRNPEGVSVSNNTLFVANSGGLDFDNPDSTVMKIDLNNLLITDTIVVGKNPGDIIADDNGNVYVVIRGNAVEDISKLVKIHADNSVEELEIPATTLSIRNNQLYISHYEFNQGTSTVSVYDCLTGSLESNYINSQEITTLYGVYPYKEDELICIDAMSFTNTGYIRIFGSDGQLKKSYNVELNPNTVVKL